MPSTCPSGEASHAWEFLDTDQTTIVTAASADAARSAVGAMLDVVDRVLQGDWRHGFAALRPPGHHNGCSELLERQDPKGYLYACHGGCLLNETAIAVKYAQHLMEVGH